MQRCWSRRRQQQCHCEFSCEACGPSTGRPQQHSGLALTPCTRQQQAAPCLCCDCSGLCIIGVVAILSFLVGLFGSCYKRWCLSVYLMLGTLVTLAELGIVLSLFFNLDNVIENMSNYQLSKQDQDFQEAVKKGNATWVWDK